MICNYQNIYDYCLNKFSYQYATTPVSASGDLVTSVIRTDKDTGEIITISPDSNLYVLPCDNNDIVEVMSVWECYEIYVSDNKIVSQPSLVTLNTIQKENTIKNYDNNLQDGVTIKIDSYNTIILDGKIENQIHLGNVICLANILYNEDANSVMPYILDINNIAYYLNYSTLKNILTKYFQKVSDQKMAKDDLLNQLETIKTSDDILNKYYCNEKVSKNILKENIVIDYSTYKEVSIMPTEIEICQDNSDCESGYYCCKGFCEYAVTSNILNGIVTLPVGTASCDVLQGGGPPWSYAGACEAAPPAFGMPENECVCCCPDGYTPLDPINCPCLCVPNE